MKAQPCQSKMRVFLSADAVARNIQERVKDKYELFWGKFGPVVAILKIIPSMKFIRTCTEDLSMEEFPRMDSSKWNM